MRLRYAIAASAAALALGLGAPAYAQTTGVDEGGPGSADDNVMVDDTANDFLDLLSNNNNGDNRDNDSTEVGGDGNSASRGGEVLNAEDSFVASKGGVNDNDTSYDLEYNLTSDYDLEYNLDSGTDIVANQDLTAVNVNMMMDQVVDLDGEDDSGSAVGYNSGQNQIRGNAFAAFAGILNQAWNTGINANTQAATNIAAQGTVNFGSGDSSGDGGGGAD